MAKKNLWKSKTVWAGIIITATGLCQAFGINVPYEVIYSLSAGLGIYGVRDAIEKNK